MSRKQKKSTVAAASSSPRLPGPIAKYRLLLAVAACAVMTGRPLLDAASSGQHLDLALGRSFAAAALVWVAAGRANRVLIDAERKRLITGRGTVDESNRVMVDGTSDTGTLDSSSASRS
jgi:hypothetical protein